MTDKPLDWGLRCCWFLCCIL